MVSAPISKPAIARANSAQLADAANVHQEARREQVLPHRRDQIRAAGDDLRAGRMLRQQFNRFGDGARAEKLEVGESH